MSGLSVRAGRSRVMVQYWRSMDHLMAYATNCKAEHLPPWEAFNQAVGTSGAVGIWHEIYGVSPGRFESVYVNMQRFGLGKAGSVVAASGSRKSACGRLGEQPPAF
ncbi:MAG: DUF4188 domain-containing protein [Burkholderiaceae bacterium]